MSIFFTHMGYTAEMILTIYRVATITYVFRQFIKFMENFETRMSVSESPEIDEVDISNEETYYKTLTKEQKTQISKRLNQWVENKGYTESGITIDNVATYVATNRTYMSIYINSTYGCSFRAWVTLLRVERAKELLLRGNSTIDISRSVGFSSPQSFMHSFKRTEGCTPTQWRNTNKKIDINESSL